MITGENEITSINTRNLFIKSTKVTDTDNSLQYWPIGKAKASHETKLESSHAYK